MASLRNAQVETIATIDTAKAMIDKVLTVMEIMVNMPSMSLSVSDSPMKYLLQLLEHAGVTYEDLKLWLTDFLVWVVPAMEIGLKAVLLTNLKNMVSCSIDPRIPEKYRKQHKSPGDRNTPNEYGIDIDIESIDFLDKMSVSPLSDYGRDMYFGLYGVDDVYKFARADDFDAFLWFVIHKGKFPMASEVSPDLHEFNDRIHGNGNYHIEENSPSLFQELNLRPEQDESSSSILPGNTFVYKGDNAPNIVSMCIDAFRNAEDKITHNTLVPVSDDLTSVNWYIRRKDQLGANLFGSYIAAKAEKTEYEDRKGRKREKTTGSTTNSKTRDFSKERAICNLQYIDQSYGDQRIPGLASNKVRFTILPKPYIHIPNTDAGEPPWRFKKLLFDANGFPDSNGKYTIPEIGVSERLVCVRNGQEVACNSCTPEEPCDEKDIFISVDGNDLLYINVKNGGVVVKNRELLLTKLVECYPGLTIYEFNYDYVMGMKLFDAKVLASTLLQTLVNTKVGISLSLDNKHQENTDRIKSIIREIINRDGEDIDDCAFSFDNSKYDELLRNAEAKRARRQQFGRVTRDAGVFDSVNELLKEYDSIVDPSGKREKMKEIIDNAAVLVSEGSDDEDKYEVQYSFVLDLIENLIVAMMNVIMSPKVLMLLEVNQRLMGGTWKMLTGEDILRATSSVITALAKELRDLMLQELLKLLMKALQPIVELLGSLLIRERLEYYAETIENIIKNCPVMWLRFGNQLQETKLDTVDYADIDTSRTRSGDEPENNNC